MTDETIDNDTGTIAVREPRDTAVMPGFTSNASWELAQRVAKAFAASTLVPAHYQSNLPNCIVALEMANRMGASPLLVMQNLYIVHGNPGWSSKFLIASFNQCGRFSSLRYAWNADRTACRAWAVEKATGERIDGPLVSVQMAKEEGWSTKSGSKWKTMPELMLMYRAAAFLIRAYAPEISMGLRSDDEIIDTVDEIHPTSSGAAAVKAALGMNPAAAASKTLQQFIADVQRATDSATAAMVLDEARDTLSETDRVALAVEYEAKWGAA